MAQLQHKVPLRQRQAGDRQGNHLSRCILLQAADALQAHLVDLLEGVALLAGTVYIFQIIEPSAAPLLHLGIFRDGERHVRLEGHEAPVQIRKGEDLLVGEKAAVLLIESVFLKPAHVVVAETSALIQLPQLQGKPLLRPQKIQIQFQGSPSSQLI